MLRAAWIWLAAALVACTSASGHASSAAGKPTGPARPSRSGPSTSRSVLLAEIYGQALAAARFPVRVLPNLGPRELVDPALMG
jgi:hypothetical protein